MWLLEEHFPCDPQLNSDSLTSVLVEVAKILSLCFGSSLSLPKTYRVLRCSQNTSCFLSGSSFPCPPAPLSLSVLSKLPRTHTTLKMWKQNWPRKASQGKTALLCLTCGRGEQRSPLNVASCILIKSRKS